MKIGIIYYSKTGTTKRLAEIAADYFISLSHQVSFTSIDQYLNKKEEKFDLLIIGSYCDSNNYPKKVQSLFDSIKINNKISTFITHATNENGPYYDKWAGGCEKHFINYCNKNSKINKGYFHCRAKASFAIKLFIQTVVFKNNKEDWMKYKKDQDFYPRQEEIDKFMIFLSTCI